MYNSSFSFLEWPLFHPVEHNTKHFCFDEIETIGVENVLFGPDMMLIMFVRALVFGISFFFFGLCLEWFA